MSGIDLLSVVSPRILKWETIPQYKTLKAAQKVFFGASKEVIVELRSTANERHLLIGLKDKGTPKKTTVEATKERVVKAEPMALNESSSEYVEVFHVSFSIPSKRVIKKVKKEEYANVMDVKTVLITIMERLDKMESKIDKMESNVDGLENKVNRLEAKVDSVEERLSL